MLVHTSISNKQSNPFGGIDPRSDESLILVGRATVGGNTQRELMAGIVID
jgi:hypothetical protein